MNDATSKRPITFSNCVSCEALIQTDAVTCWLCGKHVTAAGSENPYQSPMYEPPVEIAAGSTVAVIGLALALCVIVVGAGLAMPPVGMLLAVVLFPAFVRTAVVSCRNGQAAMDVGNTVYTFFSAVCAVFVAGMAAFGAFFATCCVACFGALSSNNQSFFEYGAIAGGVVGVIAAGGVLYGFWKRPNPASHTIR